LVKQDVKLKQGSRQDAQDTRSDSCVRRKNTIVYSHLLIASSEHQMNDRPTARISSRKQPKQARSAELVAAILQAAAQVLAEEGAQRFTTARVADKAGVSIGSLYQYFPNKAAILFRLQSDEWQKTGEMLHTILQDRRHPPLQRLRSLVHAFIRSEHEELRMRLALDDAAPLYRHAPEARDARGAGDRLIGAFMRDVLPQTPEATRDLAGNLMLTVMSSAGKEFLEASRSPKEIAAFAEFA
jgi:AcrR family transcriptional regulator